MTPDAKQRTWRVTTSALLLLHAALAWADDTDGQDAAFRLHGYATANYFAFDWDTDPERRNAIDLERLTLYPSWSLDDGIELEAEIEFEHGGTGATMEFDRFEEFGEFETEVEKGGEVVLEQLHLRYAPSDWATLKIGRFKLPVGLAATHDEPSEYFTTTRSQAEAAVIPVNWYENGLQVELQRGTLARVSAAVVNGLDSSGFSSARWVASGYQTRFEQVNADALALCLAVHLHPRSDLTVSGSLYRGDSAANRPKLDLEHDAIVTIKELHAELSTGPVTARAMYLSGDLSNSDQVTRANRNLSNNLNVKRTPVGAEARAIVGEVGLHLSGIVPSPSHPLDLFLRHESYDSMQAVEGLVIDVPRWDRTSWTTGINWRALARTTLKAEYSRRELGIKERNRETTISTGFGVEF
ncbi:MAG: autotransporter outer membrane beta-barrel domain-containing protein [Candidatus Eisenbacteria bacterium]|nr:autotransporter outer membrane beta-barrel domain-containing protein [Candidatus Eisenbacteria bacterium]MCC7140829.1 autotransporter outer membrane beta-barrel domain-containing protein [Candidatus Eisenbacteria bacterium]